MLVALSGCSFHEQQISDASAATDGTPDGAVDCVDRFEPNNDLQQATIAMVANEPLVFLDLAICPGTDEDFFFIPLEAGDQAIDIRLVREGAATIALELLNSTGTTLGFGTDSGNETHLCLSGLPMSVFFARVSEAIETRYRITFSTPVSCN